MSTQVSKRFLSPELQGVRTAALKNFRPPKKRRAIDPNEVAKEAAEIVQRSPHLSQAEAEQIATIVIRETDGLVAYADEVSRPGFTMNPNGLLLHPALSDGAKLLGAAILYFARQDDNAFPSHETVSRVMHWSEDKVERLQRELVAAKLLTIHRRKHGRGNEYDVRALKRLVSLDPKDLI